MSLYACVRKSTLAADTFIIKCCREQRPDFIIQFSRCSGCGIMGHVTFIATLFLWESSRPSARNMHLSFLFAVESNKEKTAAVARNFAINLIYCSSR